MQTDNRILDDLAKLATGAAGAAQGLRQEIETLVRQRVERMIYDLDLVPREEFEAVKDMARKAREENESLKKRVEALEKEAGGTTGKGRTGGRKTGTASGSQKTRRSPAKSRSRSGRSGAGNTGQSQ